VVQSCRPWSGLRAEFDGLLGGLDLAEKREYVRLQRAWIDAQHTMEQGIRQLTEAFELHALESLRSALITLTGQYIDPKVAKINTATSSTPVASGAN